MKSDLDFAVAVIFVAACLATIIIVASAVATGRTRAFEL